MEEIHCAWRLSRYQKLLDGSFEYFAAELASVPNPREFMMFVCARGRLDLFNHMVFVGFVPTADCLRVADKLLFNTLLAMDVKPDARCMYDICRSGDVYKFSRVMESIDFTNTSRLTWLEKQWFGHSLLYAAIEGQSNCSVSEKGKHQEIINKLLFMGLRDHHCIQLAIEKGNNKIFETLLLNGHTMIR